MTIRSILALLIAQISTILPYSSLSIAQSGPANDPSAFVDFQLKFLSSFKSVSEKRNTRSLVAQQIKILSAGDQQAVNTALLKKIPTADANEKVDIAGILAAQPGSWSTATTEKDADELYSLFRREEDPLIKSALDSALVNARGFFRDGINDFRNPKPDSLQRAEAKLRSMAQRYPESRFAENAAFYAALSVANQFLVKEPKEAALLSRSNQAFEEFMRNTENKKFAKSDFHAAAYFYRGINAWIQNNIADARSWMDRGSKKFGDGDSIYVYQILLRPGDKDSVIDRFLPAQSAFIRSLMFFKSEPISSYNNPEGLTKALREL